MQIERVRQGGSKGFEKKVMDYRVNKSKYAVTTDL